jgi:hypothetical protein
MRTEPLTQLFDKGLSIDDDQSWPTVVGDEGACDNCFAGSRRSDEATIIVPAHRSECHVLYSGELRD